MGRNCAIDFKNILPSINLTDSNKYCTLDNSSTSICDRNGNVIFYSNALRVFNKNGHVMPNGSTFNIGTISNSYASSGSYYPPFKAAIIVPFPNDTNKLYMFYKNLEYTSPYGDYLANKLYYLIVDKTLDNGLGDVVQKDLMALNVDTLTNGEVMAIKHSNGNSWWIITRKYRGGEYYKILVDSQGVHQAISQTIGQTFNDSFPMSNICTSNIAGDKLVYLYSGQDSSRIDFFDFDRCIGNLINYQRFNWTNYHPNSYLRACCLSPNNRFLYIHDFDSIWQLDLSASNILTSAVFLGITNPYSQLFFMKNAPNGQIYVSHYGSWQNISVIQYPDSFGTACNFLLDTVHFGSQLNGPWADGGIPNTPNFALGKLNCNVGIEGVVNENEGLNIYPNPASDELRIKSSELRITKVEVMDLLSRVMLTKEASANDLQLSIHNLSNGIYLLKITDEKGSVITKKIVKE